MQRRLTGRGPIEVSWMRATFESLERLVRSNLMSLGSGVIIPTSQVDNASRPLRQLSRRGER